MTPKEFKAWFEGFTEALPGIPTEMQWAKIKERVAQIDGTPTTYPVYWPRVRPWYEDRGPFWYTQVYSAGSDRGTVSASLTADGAARWEEKLSVGEGGGEAPEPRFDALTALRTLGKVDYAEAA